MAQEENKVALFVKNVAPRFKRGDTFELDIEGVQTAIEKGWAAVVSRESLNTDDLVSVGNGKTYVSGEAVDRAQADAAEKAKAEAAANKKAADTKKKSEAKAKAKKEADAAAKKAADSAGK